MPFKQPDRPDNRVCSRRVGSIPSGSCGESTKRCCEKLREWCDWLRGVHIHKRAFGTLLRRRQSLGWEDAYEEWFETELERTFQPPNVEKSRTDNRKGTGTDDSRMRTYTEGSDRSRRSAPPTNGRSFNIPVVVDQTLGSFLDSAFDARSEGSEENELHIEPPEYEPSRRGAVSAEAYGIWNMRHAAFTPPYFWKTEQTASWISEILKECPFMYCQGEDVLQGIVEALPMEFLQMGECILRQGEHADAAIVVLSGSADVFIEPLCTMTDHVEELERDEMVESEDSDGSEIFDGGCNESALESPSSRRDSDEVEPCGCGIELDKREFVRTIGAGGLFGEMSLLWGRPQTQSVYAGKDCMVSRISREVFQSLLVRHNMSEREKREECVRKVTVFETLSDEEISQLADALEKQSFGAGEDIIRQGDWGNEFFIVISGECSVIVETGNQLVGRDIQEHAILGANSLFGERALIERTTRTATIRTRTPVEVFRLKRKAFVRMLGPLSNLHVRHYLSDPRKCLADFFKPGGQEGPRATLCRSGLMSAAQVAPLDRTDWFAVYRPTSRDAIAKMIGGTAVGKGLNVKGKSSKKNRLSGFVPFLQISDNSHKAEIEQSPPDARLNIFYSSLSGRATALAALQLWLLEDAKLQISTQREIYLIEDYQGVYGLDVPEVVMRKVYIEQPDLSPVVGWETGRKSEPAFMDMNLHAIRGNVEPEVVLYQYDAENPLNPHGLLIAYAELMVRPVVSDFDTFTIGSRGMKYERLPSEQARLAMWSLEHTLDILRNPGSDSWNSRWLEVLRKANEEGFHPDVPEYGFGDATSSALIKQLVNWTSATGAVRHGAESFNFYFPQELDEEYLVIWEQFPDKPWAYKSEAELRLFLLERVREGYSFPINPVWPVRDKGWYEIFKALLENEDPSTPTTQSWYPADSGLVEYIDAVHGEFQDCFSVVAKKEQEEDHAEHEEAKAVQNPRLAREISDLDLSERADLGLFKLGLKAARWRKNVKTNLRRLNSNGDAAREGQVVQFDCPCEDSKTSAHRYTARFSTSSHTSAQNAQSESTAMAHGVRSVRFRSEWCRTVEENPDEDASVVASAPDMLSVQADENNTVIGPG